MEKCLYNDSNDPAAECSMLTGLQKAGIQMNRQVTSQEEILKVCREMIASNQSLNLRQIAARLNVAVGSIYHYFPSKTELMNATVESVWMEIFEDYGQHRSFKGVRECVEWLFDCLNKADRQYAGFLSLHGQMLTQMASSQKLDDEGAKVSEQKMSQSLHWLLNPLKQVIDQDPAFQRQHQNENWSSEDYARTLLTLILSSFLLKTIDEPTILRFIEYGAGFQK